MQNILVIGATGPQARPVAEKLAKDGFKVRALVRDKAKAEDLEAAGVELAVGTLEDRASVAAAMVGQEGVFLLISYVSGSAKQAYAAIDAAVEAGVKKIVWNATGPMFPFKTGNPSIDMRHDILAALEKSNIPYVSLQPTVYMENLLLPFVSSEVAERNTLAYPMPNEAQCQWISHQDAASFAVTAFKDKGTENLSLPISGPAKVTGPQIAEGFSKALGRQITFRPMPPREFADKFAAMGTPNGEAVASYYETIFKDPSIMDNNVDYDAALSRLPIKSISVEDFARHYRSAFGS
jgi:NAD(P)H dehydrogenase (quinone)